MEDCGSAILRRLLDALPDAVLDTHMQHGDATARVEAARILDVLRLLRDDGELDFEMLSDLTAVDYLGEEPRFEVVYHLYSVAKNHRVRIKARVGESAPMRAPQSALSNLTRSSSKSMSWWRMKSHGRNDQDE